MDVVMLDYNDADMGDSAVTPEMAPAAGFMLMHGRHGGCLAGAMFHGPGRCDACGAQPGETCPAAR